MKKFKISENIFCAIFGLIYGLLSCCRTFVFELNPVMSVLFSGMTVIVVFVLNAAPLLTSIKTPTFRLKACRHGVVCLKGFIAALVFALGYHIWLGASVLPDDWWNFLWSCLFCTGFMSVLFWNGMITLYCASVQLGVKGRAKGLLCGLLPVANIVMLFKIIGIVDREIDFEAEKIALDEERRDKRICRTKYPLLFVHGVFFRDYKHLNYWGRIPEAVIKNGGTVFFGNHQSAASVENAGRELAVRIREITEKTGCGKVNIIAHSKGGLDSRYAIARCGVGDKVASLTTVNTPHRGCLFAEYLLGKAPPKLQSTAAAMYNGAMRRLGDSSPDFLAAVNDLRAEVCSRLDRELIVPDSIYKQSVGSLLTHASGGKFPLNFSYSLVKYFDGPNDGLVAETSFKFGNEYTLLKPLGKRGISHGDMIDLNRENIYGFDVREFYVELISGLREKGF